MQKKNNTPLPPTEQAGEERDFFCVAEKGETHGGGATELPHAPGGKPELPPGARTEAENEMPGDTQGETHGETQGEMPGDTQGETPGETQSDAPGDAPAGRAGRRQCRSAAKRGITVREMTLFAMFGAMMYCSKVLMEWAPNVHFLALFIIVLTVVYRWKALIPIYVFIFLTGLMNGFSLWWVPYLYIWLPLFFLALALPQKMPKAVAVPVYMLAGGLHGMLFGTLYAPAQALFFHLNFAGMISWIVAGLPWDAVHAAGNLAACTLAVPMIALLRKLEKLG